MSYGESVYVNFASKQWHFVKKKFHGFFTWENNILPSIFINRLCVFWCSDDSGATFIQLLDICRLLCVSFRHRRKSGRNHWTLSVPIMRFFFAQTFEKRNHSMYQMKFGVQGFLTYYTTQLCKNSDYFRSINLLKESFLHYVDKEG